MLEVGIVGGGPGGLMAARQFREKCPALVRLTVLEASDRLGGKLVTRRFPESGIAYAAGVAEIYDYRALGDDPLARLIATLGLSSTPMGSRTVVLGEHILDSLDAVERALGAETRRQIEAFHGYCAAAITPADYYDSRTDTAESKVLARMNGQDLLTKHVSDDAARRYLRAAAHSDIAAPLHLTNAINTVRNVLMDVDGYIELRSIDGDVQRLTDAMAQDLIGKDAAEFALGTRATKIGCTPDGRYRVTTQGAGGSTVREFDILVVALPLSALSQVEWEGAALDTAMTRHIRRFDRPGHYLRVSVLFEKPFWRNRIAGDWWISDAFGGCCVYDESARSECGDFGVLGWLIAGNAALEMANLGDDEIVARVLASLPADLRAGAAFKREAGVHRWLASVNAIPGGVPELDIFTNHVPEPAGHPALYVVGDYLFDSTINAVIDSADAATDLALDAIARRQPRKKAPARRIGRSHFRNYRGLGPYEQVWNRFLDARTFKALAQEAWGLRGDFSVLDAGSACGFGVEALRAQGLDAWGIESDAGMHARTPASVAAFNKLGDVRELPFPDGHFDVVYETCLAHVPDASLSDALAELHRVSRHGVFFGSVTADLAVDLMAKYDLVDGVPRLRSFWEWSELFRDAGFEFAVEDPTLLAKLWEAVAASGFGTGVWFDDAESLRHCFYRRAG
ncbi:MAG: FAD-dependent oxidoreductase [Proteobacteria bacterium]|nr:FAD-dependent oxidoreductase [Pseudomonadota bacterium]